MYFSNLATAGCKTDEEDICMISGDTSTSSGIFSIPVTTQLPGPLDNMWNGPEYDIDMCHEDDQDKDGDNYMGRCKLTYDTCMTCKCKNHSCTCTWGCKGRPCCEREWKYMLDELKEYAPKTNNGDIICYGCYRGIYSKKVIVGHLQSACNGGKFAMYNLRLTCSNCERKNGSEFLYQGKYAS